LPLCEWTPIAMLLDPRAEPMSPLATAVLIEVRKKFLAQLHNAHEMAKACAQTHAHLN
jgi:hypothetical protein